MPDSSIIALRTRQFNDILDMAVQQERSHFADKVMTKNHTGSIVSVADMVEAVTVNRVATIGAPIVHSAQEFSRRWCAPSHYDKAFLFDEFEKLECEINPQSEMASEARMAAERDMDDQIINAFFGDALTGTNATSTVTWATEGANNVVAETVGGTGGAAVGLNVAKLKAARKILKKNLVDIDREPVFIAYNAEADEDLLGEAQIVSSEYNKPVLQDGKLVSFMGFYFVPTERLITDGTYRRIPVWTKKAMHYGTWKAPMVNITQRTDLTSQPYQVYLMGSHGAVRRDPKRLVEIKIAE